MLEASSSIARAAEDNSLPTDRMSSDTLVILAAYNEADRIGATLSALAVALPGAPVFVADDGSTDATPEIARRAGARVVRSERVIGKGGAVTMGAREALSAYGSSDLVILFCDGDLGESAAKLGSLVDVVRQGQTDVAVAVFARREGGGMGLAVGFARWAIRRRCGLPTRAPISGQRALRARALRDVLPLAHGFGMEIGVTIDAVRAGHRVTEIELDLSHRTTGRTFSGFLHRGRQLIDFMRVFLARRE
jgi:glycosyltransferase involved in cell wall biosynthesis